MKENRGRLPHPKGGGADEIHIKNCFFDYDFNIRFCYKSKIDRPTPKVRSIL